MNAQKTPVNRVCAICGDFEWDGRLTNALFHLLVVHNKDLSYLMHYDYESERIEEILKYYFINKRN